VKHKSWFGSFLIKFAAFRVIEKKNKETFTENKESRVQRGKSRSRIACCCYKKQAAFVSIIFLSTHFFSYVSSAVLVNICFVCRWLLLFILGIIANLIVRDTFNLCVDAIYHYLQYIKIIILYFLYYCIEIIKNIFLYYLRKNQFGKYIKLYYQIYYY
jgi:hypothetical protein